MAESPSPEAGASRELLAEFSELVADDELVGAAPDFMQRVAKLVDDVYATGLFPVASDPFRGRDAQLAEDSHHFYVLFWRMFDCTPAAMLQGFAIELRRILAQKVFAACGEGVTIHHKVLFSSGRNIELGEGVFINRNVMLDDRDRLTVGDHTLLAAGTIVETHDHVYDDFTQPLPYGGRGLSPVSIGSNCLIGYNAVVLAGRTIGNRVIVASNSVVTKDVEDRHIVGGVPARVIKRIEPQADPPQ